MLMNGKLLALHTLSEHKHAVLARRREMNCSEFVLKQMSWARPHRVQYDQSVSAYVSQSAIITLNWVGALCQTNA